MATAINSVGFGLGVNWHLFVEALMPPTELSGVGWPLVMSLHLLVLAFVVQLYYVQNHAPEPLLPSPAKHASVRRTFSSFMCFIGAVVLAFVMTDWLVAIKLAPPGDACRPIQSIAVVLVLLGIAAFAGLVSKRLESHVEHRGLHCLHQARLFFSQRRTTPALAPSETGVALAEDNRPCVELAELESSFATSTVTLELTIWWKRVRLLSDVCALCSSLLLNNLVMAMLNVAVKRLGCSCCEVDECSSSAYLSAALIMAFSISGAGLILACMLGIVVDGSLRPPESPRAEAAS